MELRNSSIRRYAVDGTQASTRAASGAENSSRIVARWIQLPACVFGTHGASAPSESLRSMAQDRTGDFAVAIMAMAWFELRRMRNDYGTTLSVRSLPSPPL